MFSRRTRRDIFGWRGNKHGGEPKQHAVQPKKGQGGGGVKGTIQVQTGVVRPLTWCGLYLITVICFVFSLNPISNSSLGQGTLFCMCLNVTNLHAKQLSWKPLIMGPHLSLENAHQDISLLLFPSTVRWKRLLRVLQPFKGKLTSTVLVC